MPQDSTGRDAVKAQPMDALPKRAVRDTGGMQEQVPGTKRGARASQQTGGSSSGQQARPAAQTLKTKQAGRPQKQQKAFDLQAWAGEGVSNEVLQWLQKHLDAARDPKAYPGGRIYTFVGDPMSKASAAAA